MLFISAREGFADEEFFNGSHRSLTDQRNKPTPTGGTLGTPEDADVTEVAPS